MAERRYREEPERAGGYRGPGGTTGGTASFVVGLALAVVGAYLMMERAQLVSGYWGWFGANTFGLTLVPLILGIGLLFFNGRSTLGWLLSLGGVLIIVAGITLNLSLYFPRTSVFDFVVMAGLFAAGLGLMARGVLAGR
jgi:hypothetical protein